MAVTDEIALKSTKRKLQLLEATYEASRKEPDADAHYKQVSRRSLKQMINQLKEEIARFESKAAVKGN